MSPEAPVLPKSRGPISEGLIEMLAGDSPVPPEVTETADPLGEDLQLALYVCYELHYRGFAGVDDGWEWDPELLRTRGELERRFLTALRTELPDGQSVDDVLGELLVERIDATGVSHFLRDTAEWWQLREYIRHRSIYHLKEADPHAWVIPRLHGRAKAALVAVEYDEFGGGRAERMHSRLFADLMADLDLDPAYGAYLDRVPAVTLATVNLMSLFGLHRGLRGALVGHFAAAEITTAPSAKRMVQALERLGAGPRAVLFFSEHIEADAVHEQMMRHEVIEDLLRSEPDLSADVVLGVQATNLLEDRLADHLLTAWGEGRSSLLAA